MFHNIHVSHLYFGQNLEIWRGLVRFDPRESKVLSNEMQIDVTNILC